MNYDKNKKLIIASLYPFPHSIGYFHDANASIMIIEKNQAKVYSYEEEKLSTTKNDYISRFAERSLMFGCKELNITPQDIDVLVVGQPIGVDTDKVDQLIFRDILKIKKNAKIVKVLHHNSHAALAVYGSGFKEGIFVSIDGGGDEGDQRDFSWGTFNHKKMKNMGGCSGDRGLAYLNHLLTEASGFSFLENGKAMGLGSYGKLVPEIHDFLRKKVVINNENCVQCLFTRYALSNFRMHKLKSENYNRPKIVCSPEGLNDFYDFVKIYPAQDVSFTVQKFTEGLVVEIIDRLVEKTKRKHKHLVLSGGFFQNILVNKMLHENKDRWNFESIYIPMGCNDSGISLGMCFYALYNILNKKTPDSFFPRDEHGYLTPFLGPSFDDSDIEKLLKEYGLRYDFLDNKEALLNKTIDFIEKKKVLGWFQGRAELGPRSLLARSVLADPRDIKIKDRVNQLLKKRDWFMPYAPAILDEKISGWFKNFCHSPYMAIAFDVYPNKQKLIPSAVHIDKTTRPNSVSLKTNPIAYRLLKKFFAKTKVPLLLNTSFNRHGIATISTPRQAIDHLLAGNIELLVIGNFIVYREFVQDTPNLGQIISPKLFELMEYIKPLIRLAYFGSKKEISEKKKSIDMELKAFSSKQGCRINVDLENNEGANKIKINNKFNLEIPSSGKKSIDIYFDQVQEYLVDDSSKILLEN